MKALTEFGSRVVALHGGSQGLRGGLLCTVKEVAGEGAVFDFIASDDTLDRYNERVRVDGWQLENFRANPVIPDCHEYSSIGRILGRALSIDVKDGKLVNRVEFCLDNPLGAMASKMAAKGFLNSQSVGFIPLEWENGKGADAPDRIYTKQELLEVSMVVVPANPGATVGLALKGKAITREDVRKAIDHLEQFCGEEADPGAIAGASGAGVFDAQLLQLARGLNQVLRGV
jgi:HK97 family phage prohead protease